MKRKIIFGLVFSTVALLGLAGCKNNSTIEATFDEDEYIFSVNDQVSFYDCLNAHGVKKEDVVFVSSNQDVLTSTNDGFLAKASGETILLAKYKSATLASVKVVVKYKYASPKNFVINQESGVLTWDNSYVTISGEKQYATDYQISVMDIADGNTDKEYQTENIEGNSYQFEEAGSYRIHVVAKSDSKYIEDSQASENYDVFYNAMGLIENLSLSYNYGLNGSATFGWLEKENAVYDVYINDIKVFEGREQNGFTYDFSPYDSQNQIKIEIDAIDSTEETSHTRSKFFISKYATPNVRYNYVNGDGYLSWDNNASFGYTIYPQVVAGNYNFEILENFDAGLQEISFIANGGMNQGGYFLTSNQTQNLKVAKLAVPNVDVTFSENKATLRFPADDYVRSYRLFYAGRSRVVQMSQLGGEYELLLSDIREGQYTFEITALPTYESGAVKPYEVDGQSTTKVLNSDAYQFVFYVLKGVENLTHGFDANGKSILSFDNIPNADKYEVKVNGTVVAIADNGVSANEDRTSIKLEKSLNEIEPQDNRYSITIKAYRADGQATNSLGSKIIEILSASTNGRYNDGVLSWTTSSNGQYQYSIFSYNKQTETKTLIDEGITANKFVENNLEVGYYILKVVNLSTNTDRYLNSNYYDSNNYLLSQLTVSTKLATPNVTFEDDNGDYSIDIDPIDFSSQCTVIIDNDLDNPIVVSDESFPYHFAANTFDEVKTYSIKVIANAGRYDGVLYNDSEVKTIFLTRLSQPQFRFTNVYDEYGYKSEERLYIVNKDANASAIYANNAQLINDQLNVKDYDNQFDLIMESKARNAYDDNYFIDSVQLTVSCSRVAFPTNIVFENDYISFVSSDHEKIDEYYITIKISNTQKLGFTLSKDNFLIENGRIYINYQTLVGLVPDAAFKTALDNANSVDITISSSFSSGSKLQGGIYYLPSKESAVVTVEKLEKPVITSFNKNTQVLSWNAYTEQDVTFKIYANNIEIKSDYSATSISLRDLTISESELFAGVKIKVEANHPNYITSQQSNEINITKLASVSEIGIAKVNGIWTASINILQTSVASVKVNSNNMLVESSTLSFDLNSAIQNYTLQFISKDVDGKYYIDSDVTNVQIVALNTLSFTAAISAEDKIIYNDLYTEFNAQLNPVVYTAIINGGHSISLGAQSLSIQEIETVLGTTFNPGTVSITVNAKTQNYTTAIASGSKICYGEINSNLTTNKLESVGQISVQTNYSSSSLLLEQKLYAYSVLSWQNKWGSVSNLQFSVKINNSVPFDVSVNDSTEAYGFVLIGSNYELTLKKDILPDDENTIEIAVKQAQSINSEKSYTTVERCLFTQEDVAIQVGDEGLLTITTSHNYKFIAQVAIENTLVEVDIVDNQLNLMSNELLNGKYGAYTIKVIPYDDQNKLLPAANYRQIAGEKIRGIQTLEVDEIGRVELQLFDADYSNLEWIVKTENVEKTFVPTIIEGRFYIPLIELVNKFKNDIQLISGHQYTFEITVRKVGSINGDWNCLVFVYNTNESTQENPTAQLKTGKLGKDYLIFRKTNGNDAALDNVLNKTSGFAVKVVGDRIEKEIYFTAEEIEGYWNENEKYFTKEVISGSGIEECYALSLNNILEEYLYGDFSVYFSRVCDDGVSIIQFNQCKVDVYKLNQVGGIHFETNMLSWERRGEQIPTSYVVEFNINGSPSITIESNALSIDLRTVGLTEHVLYNVSIRAISRENDIVSSNKATSGDDETMLYATLPSLVVENGKIVFDATELKTAHLENEFNLFELLEQYLKTEDQDPAYSAFINNRKLSVVLNEDMSKLAPFYTTFASFEKAAVRLILTKKEGGALTSQRYVLTTSLFNLLPEFEWVDELMNRVSIDTPAIHFLSLLKNASHGIGSNNLLIDDFGGKIPAGEYQLSAYRCNDYDTGDYATNIRNTYVESAETIFSDSTIQLLAHPKTEFSYKTNESSAKNEYFVTLTAVEGVINYKMLVRPDKTINIDGVVEAGVSQNPNYKFLMITPIEYQLQFNEGAWTIKVKNDQGELVDLTSELITADGLNLTQLIYATNAVLPDIIEHNQDYQVDIFGIFNDNNYKIGKSLAFKLNYLDLSVDRDKLSVVEGKILLNGLPEQGALIMKYVYETTGVQTKTIDIDGSSAQIELNQSGSYEYVMLSLQGAIQNRNILIESESYKIVDIYKYNKPNFAIQNGNLKISNGAQKNKFGYKVDSGIMMWDEERTYAQNEEILLDTAYNNANEFYIYAIGTTGASLREESVDSNHIHRIVLESSEQGSGSTIYLSSDVQSLAARILPAVGINVRNGELIINDTSTNVFESEKGEVSIIYELNVAGYSAPDFNEKRSEKVIYVERNGNGCVISSQNLGEEKYYIVNVSKIAATLADASSINKITTTDGNKFELANSVNRIK